MNIFILDTDPVIAASYHCDQHLHKMILESAQMLSTAARLRSYQGLDSILYKSAYPKHPCTLWAAQSNHNMLWICDLATSLNNIRLDLSNTADHSSMYVIKTINDYIKEEFPYATSLVRSEFVFAGPPTINIRNLSITEKYKLYYRQKHKAWLDTRRPMSYNNRPIPPFMADLFPST